MKFLVVLLVLGVLGGVLGDEKEYDFRTGNMDLKMAMDVAAVESHDTGVWGLVVGKEEGVSLPLVCSWNRNFMRYPTPDTINPKGTLANVLDHEEIVFGYVNTTIEAPHVDSHHPYIVLDTTHPQPTGSYTLWHVSMIQHLGIAYGKLIKISYKIYSSPGATLHALQKGEIHMAVSPWDLAGDFGEKRENMFLQGCPDHGKGQGKLYASSNDQVSKMSLGAFRAHQADSSKKYKIGALELECPYYEALYFKSDVVCVETIEELSGLENDFDLVSRSLPSLVSLSGDPPAVSYFGSLYRKDECVE